MLKRAFILLILPCCFAMVGCQEFRLRERTDRLSGSVTDLYYKQMLNNLAMVADDPGRLPYLGLPTQGTATIQNALQATYTPSWALITASGRFLGSTLNDRNTAGFQGSTQTTETWQTAPTTTPEKLALMKYAYQKTLGQYDPGSESEMERFRRQYSTPFRYREALRPGWYCIGAKHDVPKHAAYVGRYGKTYVWVQPERTEELSNFVLAVLDIATAAPKQGERFIAPSEAEIQAAQGATNQEVQAISGLLSGADGLPPDQRNSIESLLGGLNVNQMMLDSPDAAAFHLGRIEGQVGTSNLPEDKKAEIHSRLNNIRSNLQRIQPRMVSPSVIPPRTGDLPFPVAPPYPPPPIP